MKLNFEKIKSNNGFSGVEITVALIILMIFMSLISMLFYNVYLIYTSNKRNSEATAYATQIMELVKKMYYADVTTQKLSAEIMKMNIPNGYGVQVEVENYKNENNVKEDLVKTVVITMNYRIGKQTKSLKFETIKAKEILITPNKPKLEEKMVPVKYVINNRTTGEGYWQISAEDDPTWYNYENKKWATVMTMQNLTVEGGVTVTKENQKSLIGKKVETAGELKTWIPRFAYKAVLGSTNATRYGIYI